MRRVFTAGLMALSLILAAGCAPSGLPATSTPEALLPALSQPSSTSSVPSANAVTTVAPPTAVANPGRTTVAAKEPARLSAPAPTPIAGHTAVPAASPTAVATADPIATATALPIHKKVESLATSGSPERQNCLLRVLGEARFNTLLEGGRPSQDVVDLMEQCGGSSKERGGRGGRNSRNPSGAGPLPSSDPTSTASATAGGGVVPTSANFKVAFIGDQGSSESGVSVLKLIRDEGADMVLHQGDFDYEDDPDAWDRQISSILGPDYPYFASIGNHDLALWPAYQAKLQARLEKIAGAACIGDLGVKSACSYKGLFFILSGDRWMGAGNEDFIRDQLAADGSIWKVCSWHMNHRLMQTGDRRDGAGWELYEECRKGGAIIATGHHHTYSRTHLMDNFETQSIASTSNTLMLTRGKSFVIVSGLGGVEIVGQDDGLAANPWWASVYNSTNGANYGALFCTFNESGVENRAHCYFKDISGMIADDFYLEVQPEGTGPYAENRGGRSRGEPVLTLPPPVPAPSFDARQYQGFWEPGAGDFSGDLDHLKSLGVNTMSFGPSYSPLPDGAFSIRPDNKRFVISQIVEAHENGIQVYLVPTFWNPFKLPDPSLVETYLENFTPIVLEWADIAQQYGVALFSPVNEPDYVFPKEIVGTWLHDIIPKINDRYDGLTLTKFARLSDMNFAGYDYVGFDIIGNTRSGTVREQVALANKYAERDGARGVMIAEFGVPAETGQYGGVPGVGDEMQAEIIDRVFRESWGEVDGYFVVSWLLPEYSVKGRPAEQVIERWFTEGAGDQP